MTSARWRAAARGCAAAVMLGGFAIVGGTAHAVPIPPPDFSYDVTQGRTVLAGCTSFGGAIDGGTCGSQVSGPGYAATSGGIGTASYLSITPGGTVLGTGTAVDATSTWTSGAFDRSNATLTYSFEATGPANVDFIPIDVLSTGLLAAAGDSTAYLSLIIRDSGTDANIPPGVPDPDPRGPLLDLTAFCTHGSCFDDWGSAGQQLTDPLCVVNGDNYTITIVASTAAGPGFNADNSASATLDPVIKLDPPYPTSCSVAASFSTLGLDTSPGTSTGYAVPEPSALGLALIGAFGLGCLGIGRRAAHARLKAAVRPS